MFEKKIRIGNLFAFYGQLLTEKQQGILKYYYIHDLSLGEISENLKISRQAVYDALKRSEMVLVDYEKKLGLLSKFLSTRESVSDLIDSINQLIIEVNENYEKKHILEEIDKIKEQAIQILDESS
ncbi:MAG: YlxM family DNA-binding protein [Candidatus Bathyarchaeota archaeon]|nr:YlxM family DNA-binding protein [Candidatus Bathyarchaeota archaeon]